MNPVGSGRFVPSSAGGSPFLSVRFFAFNGNAIAINGSQYQIPGAGVDGAYNNATIDGVTGQTLAANTTYYCYAYMNGSVIEMEFSATGWVTDTSTGVAIKNGDSSRSVVGMVHTDSAGKFAGDSANQCTASFFNRVRTGLKLPITSCGTSSSSWNEPNSANRISFVCWQDDIPEFEISGCQTNDTLYGHNEVAVKVDGATAPGSSVCIWDCLSANSTGPLYAKESSSGGMTEGYHTIGVLMRCLGGTGVLRAGSSGYCGQSQIISGPVPS